MRCYPNSAQNELNNITCYKIYLSANVFSTDNFGKQFGSSSGLVNFHGCTSFAHRRETTDMSSESNQLHPFHKLDFSYRREFAPEGSQVFPFRAISYVWKNLVST